MGNNNYVKCELMKRENLINTKSITKRIQAKNFFYDMLTFPEEEKIIISTKQNLLLFETLEFKLIQTIEIKNL